MASEYFKDLENKVVLVTGSTSGMGEAIAVLFAKMGSKLVIVGRNEQRLKLVSQKCESVSPLKHKALAVKADLTVYEDVKQMMNKAIDAFGQLDVLVTAAGYPGKELFYKLTDPDVMEGYRKVSEVDVKTVLLACQQALPHLVKTKGCIVNVSSFASIREGGMPLHAITKAAVDMLTKVLALEFAPQGVRVNAVNPGPVVTPAWYGLIPADQMPMFIEMSAKNIPIGRVGHVDDTAKAVLYLASNAASFASGTNLVVDGATTLGFMRQYEI